MKTKILKRTLLLMAMLLACAVQSRATDFTYDGLTYTTLTDSTCETKSGSYSSEFAGNYVSGNLVIPETVYYNDKAYSVTKIGASAFYGCSGLTEVTIPNSVTKISAYAFYGCSGLTEVTIPNSVTEIGVFAFYHCSGIVKSAYPNSISNPFWNGVAVAYPTDAEIEDGIIWGANKSAIYFVSCKYEGDFNIPNSVTSIGESAFYGCTGLTEVSIGNSVTSIGSDAFYGCTGLTEVTIGNSVTEIGSSAFSGCTGLTEVTIPNSVTSIGTRAFYGCTALKSVTIGNSVTEISAYAFYGCSGLTEVIIPNTVNSIGEDAFGRCSGLTSVTIPNSVTSIGSYAFAYCSGLEWIESKAVTPPTIYSSTFSDYSVPLLAASDAYRTASYWNEFTNIYAPYTPTGTTFEVDGLKYEIISVNDLTCRLYAIDEIVTGENVVIPETVVYKNRTFTPIEIKGVLVDGEISVKSLSISNNSSAGIPAGIIRNASLEKLTINAPITTNYIYVSNIDELVIPSTVTEVSANLSTNNIGKITIEDSETALTTTQFKCSGTKEVYLGRNVSESTFKDMTSLKKVTISDKVTEIGKSAFEGCSGLERVNISDLSAWCNIYYTNAYGNPLFYAQHLFLDGTEVTNLVIPETVTEIKFATFYGCTGLKSVTISDYVTSIKKSAFGFCTGLTEVTIGNSVTEINNYAFYGCSGITFLNFEDGEGNLTIGTDVFTDVAPTEVYFGRQIDFSVVSHTALETVEFGENVTSIASGAFKDGTAIRTVVSRNATPPTTDDTFSNDTYLDGVLYVPDASVEAYQAAAGWKNFWEIKPLSENSGVNEIIVDNCVGAISVDNGAISVSGDVPVRIVALNGTTVYSGRGEARVNVTPGIYVVIVGNKAHKVAVR